MATDVKRRNDDPRKSVRNRRGPGQNPENAKVWKLSRAGSKKSSIRDAEEKPGGSGILRGKASLRTISLSTSLDATTFFWALILLS